MSSRHNQPQNTWKMSSKAHVYLGRPVISRLQIYGSGQTAVIYFVTRAGRGRKEPVNITVIQTSLESDLKWHMFYHTLSSTYTNLG